jgi:hypothetical protein
MKSIKSDIALTPMNILAVIHRYPQNLSHKKKTLIKLTNMNIKIYKIYI